MNMGGGHDMDLKEIILNSLNYPVYNQEHVKKWLIFGVITLASYLVIPVIFAAGYQLRTIKNTIEGDSKMPEFNQWGQMFSDGFDVIAVQLVYYLLPLIFTTAGMAYLHMGKSFGGILILISVILFILASMLLYIAISNFVYHGNFGAAFDLKQMFKRIKSIGKGKFILWWLITTLIVIIGFVLGALVNMVSKMIGFFLVPLIFNSFLSLFGARSGGLVYRESLGSTQIF